MCSQSWVGLFGNTDFEWPPNMHELIRVWLHLPAHCVRQAEPSWCLDDQTKGAIPRQRAFQETKVGTNWHVITLIGHAASWSLRAEWTYSRKGIYWSPLAYMRNSWSVLLLSSDCPCHLISSRYLSRCKILQVFFGVFRNVCYQASFYSYVGRADDTNIAAQLYSWSI